MTFTQRKNAVFTEENIFYKMLTKHITLLLFFRNPKKSKK